MLWSLSLWFASPLQLLLLFLGKVDTERPSDWILRRLGAFDESQPRASEVDQDVAKLNKG